MFRTCVRVYTHSASQVLIMNKPRGLLCTRARGSKSWCKARGLSVSNYSADGGSTAAAPLKPELPPSLEASCVYDIVPDGMNHPSLGTFGRLDKDTTGEHWKHACNFN